MTIFEIPINERSSAQYKATLRDETGALVDGTALDDATLTYYDKLTGTIINARDGQNVKNANGVTISAAGEIVWTLAPADTVIVSSKDPGPEIEEHVALFRLTWGGAGAKALNHPVLIRVRNLWRVT